MNKRHIKSIEKIIHKDNVNVLFVCLGNICRSPAAEGILRNIVGNTDESDRWHIDSAGTGRYHIGQLPDNRMRIHARRRGIELTHICRQVSESDFDDFDLIIPMDGSNESNLIKLAPSSEAMEKIIPMAEFVDMATRYDYIPDPYYEGSEGFELVLDLLENGCSRLFQFLKR